MLNMKLERIKQGMKQSDLAEKIGVDTYLIGRYERGDSEPRLKTILKISEVLKVSVDYLLGKEK